MSYAWPDVLGGIQATEDRDRANLLGAISEEVGMPTVLSGGRGRVATDAPPDPEQCGAGYRGGAPPPPLALP